MRRRILVATMTAVVVAVVLLGIPFAAFGARVVLDNQQQQLLDRLDRLMTAVQHSYDRGDEVVPEAAVQRAVNTGTGSGSAHVVIIMPDGRSISGGTAIDGPATTVGDVTESGIAVNITVSRWDAWIPASQVVMMITAVGVVAIGAAVSIAVWQANRLSAPLVYLAASAEQLASGQVRPRLAPVGVEEIDLVADELARTSDRLAGRLAAERQFTSDASHQLRTPLTALSMRLEEIELMSTDPQVQQEARISLEQVERLVGVVDDLLAASRRSQTGTTEPVRIRDVVDQQMEEWAPAYAAANRELVIDVDPALRVLVTPGAFAQVLATLIENSLKHGAGTTTVRARTSASKTVAPHASACQHVDVSAGGAASVGGAVSAGPATAAIMAVGSSRTVVVEVSDQGEGVPADMASVIFDRGVTSGNGTGLGLALARDLAASDGGKLDLLQRSPAVFGVFLSAVPQGLDPGVVLPPGATVGETSKGRYGRTRKAAP